MNRISPSTIMNYYFPMERQIPEEILVKAGNRGRHIHSKIENYFDEKIEIEEFDFDEKDKEVVEQQFANFKIEIINHKIDVKIQELHVVTDKLHGYIDCICSLGGVPTIIDWKTNSQIGEKEKEKYTLQMNLYRFMMWQIYGVNFKNLQLVHLKKNKTRNRVGFIKCDLLEFEELEKKINEVYEFVNGKGNNE